MMNGWRKDSGRPPTPKTALESSPAKVVLARLVLTAVVLTAVVLAAIGLAARVQAQPTGLRNFVAVPVPQNVRDAEGFDPKASAGLFVGVHEFDDSPFTPVLFAADDAVDLAHLFALDLELIDPTRVVLSLSGEPRKAESVQRLGRLMAAGAVRKPATQAEIYRQLHTLGHSTSARGLFVVAMATHGVANTDGDFLVGSDSLSWHLPRTGIAVSEVFSIVAESPAPRRLVMLDACRERGSAANTRSVAAGSQMSPSLAHAISQSSGQVVLFGATHGGFAYDDPERGNGVFAAAVIDGLSGQAPTDDRYFITAGTLAEYVQESVVTWVRRNRPEHIGVSQGILARLEGAAARIPLAFDPFGQEVLQDYKARLPAALSRLHQNIASPRTPTNPITGGLYDEIVRALDTETPTPQVVGLLEAVEALDGSVHTQRGVAFVHQKYRETGGASAPVARSRRKRPSSVGRRQTPRLGDKWKDSVAGIEFVYLPRGTFTAGSPVSEGGRDDDESPHLVRLNRGFWIGATEVTVLQFGRFVAETGHVTQAERDGQSQVWENGGWTTRSNISWRDVGQGGGNRDLDRPVTHVSWDDAREFVDWLSRRTGKQIRLPSEAQWEYAARAGTSTSTYVGDLVFDEPCNAPELDEVAWYCGNSGLTTQPVGRKNPNEWGLYDMLGNAAEWVDDWFGQYQADVVEDPTGPQAGQSRVVRGGSAVFAARTCRAAGRSGLDAGDHYSYLGFRVVISSSQ